MIDNHCHPFAPAGGPLDLTRFTLDVAPGPDAERRRAEESGRRLAARAITVLLAGHLGCSPADVASARAEAGADWPRYVQRLFRDAGLSELVMDVGLEPTARAAADADAAAAVAAEQAAIAGCPVRWIMRIEPVVDRAIAEGKPAGEIVDAVERAMRAAVDAGAVGFKSIMAYRTGLAVDPDVTVEQAEASLQSEAPVRRRGKACRDMVLRRALGVAAELGRPFQLHTGFGDSEIRLAESNPLLLEELLRSPEGSSATVILIHGAFPWHEEVAYLATVRPNVHVDVSLSNLFAPATLADRLLRIVELAPATKVVMGTDGHGEPETLWFGARMLHAAWQRARAAMADLAGDDWLRETEESVFERNARRLYRL